MQGKSSKRRDSSMNKRKIVKAFNERRTIPVHATCPYCKERIELDRNIVKTTCPKCGKPIVVKRYSK